MRRSKYVLIGFLAALISLMISPVSAQSEARVLVLKGKGPLTPAMAEYLDRGLAKAVREGAEAVIFELDTPGGAVDLMNRMVQSIRGSDIPVIIYVAPRGAMAGSAGTVITLAGHLAAMAPETAIGAASPVGMQGEDLGKTIQEKEKQILKATVRSLADRRGEEAVAMAESTIEAAKAASAQEALEAGLIDFIAEDLDDLLMQLDGHEVELVSGTRTLHTAAAEVSQVPQSMIEQMLHALTNPNVVFILLTIGVQAILIEISSPGGWVAGFTGVVSLALGAYGLGVLPVNWVGLIFIATAFVLFIFDIKAPTHGALTSAGLVSFIVGALVLFNSPGTPESQRVSIPLVIATAVITSSIFFAVIAFAIRAQRRPIEVGVEALIGRVGEVRQRLSPQGMVHVAGELWSAEAVGEDMGIEEGTRVEVVSIDGMRLRVKSLKKEGSSGSKAK